MERSWKWKAVGRPWEGRGVSWKCLEWRQGAGRTPQRRARRPAAPEERVGGESARQVRLHLLCVGQRRGGGHLDERGVAALRGVHAAGGAGRAQPQVRPRLRIVRL